MKALSQNAKKRFSAYNLKTKLIISYCGILFLTIVVLVVIMQAMSAYFISNVAEDYTFQIVSHLNSLMEDEFTHMNESATQILYFHEVFNYLMLSHEDMSITRESLDRYYTVQQIIEDVKNQNKDIAFISLYNLKSGEIISPGSQYTWGADKNITDRDWYDTLIEGSSYYTSTVTSNPNTGEVIRCGIARKVVDGSSGDVLGVLVIESSVDYLKLLLRGYDFGAGSVITVSSHTGELICAINEPVFTDEIFTSTRSSGIVSSNNRRFLVIPHESEETGFIIHCIIPLKNLTEDVIKAYPAYIIVILVSSFVGILVMVAVAKSVAKPLENLSEKMRNITIDDTPEHILNDRTDEVGTLIDAFNFMTEKIDNLILNAYKTEIQKQQAQIDMLHAQMDPHFLNNTLEVIRLKALNNDDYEVSRAITYLGKYMRMKLDSSTIYVTVKDEIEHITGYTKLLNVCGNSTFHLVVQIDEELQNSKIPKFSLQPLVENSVKHAFSDSKAENIIEIIGTINGDRGTFIVRDNGNGIENVEEVIKTLDDPQMVGEHIGLKNIHNRLLLLYGDTCGLQIKSRKDCGTEISFTIPRSAEDEDFDS